MSTKSTNTKLKKELKSAAKKKQTVKVILFALLLLFLWWYDNYTDTPVSANATVYEDGTLDTETSLTVHFIDVGQGDAAYIELPTGETVLIDAGTNASEDALLAYLDRYDCDTIDYAVFTHPHEDHIGGADKVLGRYHVNNVLLPDADATSSTYEKMLDGIADSGAAVMLAEVGDTYSVGEAVIRILGPTDPSDDDLNNASIVLRLEYKDVSFVFTGDAEKSSEKSILAEVGATLLDADVLKVGHHGSNTSSSSDFLDAVSPAVAVISCGENNEYGHPHKETVNALTERGVKQFRTDELGSIRIYTDGTALLVQSDKELS
ncbi:MAG: MBL fold metallo-hydrolase [Clostridia bacterium]|nr:MBL fold metallo-hydrolase [Clostridia bacterium]